MPAKLRNLRTLLKHISKLRYIRLRCDYDATTTYRARLLPFDAIRREQKVNMSIFRRSRISRIMHTHSRIAIVI